MYVDETFAVAQKTRFKPTIEVKTVGAAIPLRLTSQVVWRHAGFFLPHLFDDKNFSSI